MARITFLSSECPMQRTMGILGTKWKPVVIWFLGQRKARFGQIAASICLISRKVLTDTLKELEADGIVYREEHKEIPPRVEYSLTKRGTALLPVLKQLTDWNDQYPSAEAGTEPGNRFEVTAADVRTATEV